MKKIKKYKQNFIFHIIEKDLTLGNYDTVYTRFPPEPSGYLHIGHIKSIFLNFEIAQNYDGKCNLRFDDTNPENEKKEYVEAIKKDIIWLGCIWNDVRYVSDYFDKLYNYAIELIQKGLAYVDELSVYEIKKNRGTLTSPGKNSPYRSRDIQENLIFFKKMRDGYFLEGQACLRAKIDMSSDYMIMRDPVLYRIKFTSHHRTGNSWCIYPTYDFSHCISDAIEGITHSLCTLEFQDNRRLYDWILNHISINSRPTQYEFSRLNLKYILTSKRKLNLLISSNIVDGWDDPRLPTIAGLRRRGYTPKSIRNFYECIGISKQESQINFSVLENCVRQDLNETAFRAMAVINPIKIVIDNLPKKYEELITVPNHPNKAIMGFRNITFSKEIFIDRSDFYEFNKNNQNYYNKKFFLGGEIRLRYAYVIKAKYLEKDRSGNIICIYCSYDSNTLNKHPIDGRKISGVIHWVSATKNIAATFFLYEKLFIHPNPSKAKNLLNYINPKSLSIFQGFIENNKNYFRDSQAYQFEREGYFIIDKKKSTPSNLIFNRIVTLKNLNKK